MARMAMKRSFPAAGLAAALAWAGAAAGLVWGEVAGAQSSEGGLPSSTAEDGSGLPQSGAEQGSGLPPPTAEERAAAFSDLAGMDARKMMPENPFQTFVLLDRLEQQDAAGGDVLSWDVRASAGRNFSKLWLRSEGERQSGRTDSADLELLFGHSFARWWDYVAGVREDFRPEPTQTWAAFGVQGLAPYRFEIEATAYLGEGGRAAARVDTEYELLMTNRLILQPRVELNWYGDDDLARGHGAGLADAEIGLRLRYEIRREVAPYIGVERVKMFGRTADLAEAAGEDAEDTRIVTGIRLWF